MYALGGLNRILVFPNTDAGPAGSGQTAVGVPIPRPGGFDLLGPKARIGGRDGVVVRTAVPETAVQEHRHPHLGEHQVSSTPELAERSHRYPITQAKGVGGGAQRQLRLGIPALVRLHAGPHPGG